MSRSSLPTATEQALFECEARYRNLYDRIPAMLLSFDRDRRVVRVSNDWLAVMGYERAEVIGRDILEFVTEDSRRRALAGSLPDLESAGVTRNLSRQIVKRNGEVMEVLLSAVAESGAAGEEESFLSVTIDTTELRRAEESLRATEARLGAVVSAAPIAIWAADRDGTITLSEGKALERLGLKPGELVGRSVFDLCRDFPQDERNVPRAFAGEAFTDVFELDEGVFTSRYQPLRDANVEVDGVVGVDLDVTEHARAEKALRESEDRYRTLIEMSPDAILVQSDGIVVFANENAVRMLGGDPVGRAWADFVHPAHLDDAKRWCARMLGGEALPLAERVHVRADGSEFAAEVNAAPSVWAGKPALQVVIRDITERRRAQQQQERTRLLLRAMTEGATDGIFVKDPQGRYLMMNQAGARILGMEREDILGKTDAELLPARLARAVQADDREIAKNGETRTREDAYVRAGAERILQTTKGPCRDVDGRFIGLIGVTQDVTERKRTEQALRQSEERFRTLVEYAPEAVVLLDLQTRKFVEANTNAERLFGMPKSELLKRGPEDISPLGNPAASPRKRLRSGSTAWPPRVARCPPSSGCSAMRTARRSRARCGWCASSS